MPTKMSKMTNMPAHDVRLVMLLYKYHPVFTGAGVAAGRLAKGLIKRGISTWVITKRFSGLSAEEWIDGVRVKRLPAFEHVRIVKSALFDLLVSLHLLRHRQEFDILHIHSYTLASFVPILMARLLGKQTVIKMTLLGADDPVAISKQRWGFLRKLALDLADRVVSMTDALSESYRLAGWDMHRLVRINQGVDTERFRPPEDRNAVRASLGLAERGTLICTVASVTPRKGIDILVEAFRHVASQYADAKLLVVGLYDFAEHPSSDREHHQRYVSKIVATIERYELQEQVIFAGVVPNVHEYLQASDVFVFASRREGFGTAVVEAMATGLPCVVSSLDGISEEVVGGEGIIIEDENPLSFAQAILRLLADPVEAKAMGRRARQRAIETYSIEGTVSCYLGLYRDLVRAKQES